MYTIPVWNILHPFLYWEKCVIVLLVTPRIILIYQRKSQVLRLIFGKLWGVFCHSPTKLVSTSERLYRATLMQNACLYKVLHIPELCSCWKSHGRQKSTFTSSRNTRSVSLLKLLVGCTNTNCSPSDNWFVKCWTFSLCRVTWIQRCESWSFVPLDQITVPEESRKTSSAPPWTW